MAAAGRAPGASPGHADLCRRTVLLLRKMRADVGSLLESYVEKQGLDKNFSLDLMDGVPTASTEQWSEASDAERLRDNLKAYWAFQILLNEILEEQRSCLTPNDLDFHKSIQSVLLQVSALAYQLEELMVILEHSVPAKELEGSRDARERGLFEKKLRGMKVLQELAQWSVRSVRDLHQLSSPVQTGAIPHASCYLALKK
uniref:ciliary neurotrophic factor n=1 Tax=Euleptes europaea TaxID=460621 RepID=UPI0025415ABE|nr:ciliary neurotrophic factor [Euleptes europaea]